MAAQIIKTLKFPEGYAEGYQINAVQLNGYTASDLLDAVDGLQFKGALGTSLPAANCGHVYVVTTAGTVSTLKLEVGDMLICSKDNTAANTPANWIVVQRNVDVATATTPGIVKLGSTGGAETYGTAQQLVNNLTTDDIKSGEETWIFDCGKARIN